NPWVWLGCSMMAAAQLLFVHAPFMNRLFHSAPMPLLEWEEILGVCLLISLAVGAEKALRARKA
ncbi:MAG TPA: cation transporting ATPase C-terminal domain-containing protein, partial [Elusimicrobiales bacterium]|nr:cation transporting ATPase C-terminal domain-containing protein [Elusimicrobiales bacterium]